MKKRILFFLAFIMLLGGCSKKHNYIEQDFKSSEYNDYIIASEKTDSLNYLVSNNDSDTKIFSNIVDGLVENDNYGRIVPALSETVGQSDNNFKKWTFHVKENLFWTDSDGNATEYGILADDFVFGIQYILDPKNDSKYATLIMDTINGAKEYYSAMKKGSTPDFATVGVKAVDERTVEYSLTSSISTFNSYTTSAAFYPLSRGYYESLEEGTFASKPSYLLYNGCYYLTAISNSKISLTKNEQYWDQDSVNFNKVGYRLVKDEEEAVKLFKKGKLSIIYMGMETASDQMKKYTEYMYTSSQDKTSYLLLINFASNNTDFNTAVHNANFRKALQFGFEKAAIIPSTVDAYHNSSGTIIPEYLVINSNKVEYTRFGSINDFNRPTLYNSEKAKKYLKAAKEELSDEVNFPITIRVPISENNQMEQNLIDNLNKAFSSSLGDSIIKFEATAYTDAESIAYGVTLTDNYDMLLVGISVNGRDPYEYLGKFSENGELNKTYSHIDDKIFYSLLEAANSYTALDDRYYALNEIEAYLINEGLVIPYSQGEQKYTLSMINDYSKPIGYYGIAYKKIKGYEVVGHSVSLVGLKENYKKYVDVLQNEE